MIIAVTGITGHTGRFFLKELENHKFNGIVRCLVRESSNVKILDESPLSIEKVVGTNSDRNVLTELTKNADIVMHIFNIHQSMMILKVAIENMVPRVVLVHTTGIYSKHKMASYKYKKIEAEIDGILKTANIDVTILRPTMIFGDMCDRNISKFIKMVDKFPVMPEIEHGSGKIRPVNARDLAKTYYTVCMANHLPEVCYDLSGERSLTLHELFDMIGNYLGKKIYHISCPLWLGSAGANCLKVISHGKIDFVERILRMNEDRDYGHEAATRDFGYIPEYFIVGLEREVEQYKKGKKYD